MPKTREGVKYKKMYDEEAMQQALDCVRNKSMSQKKAAETYKVSRSSLQFRLSKKFKKTSYGPSPILSPDEEKTLVNWLKDCARKGFPRRKEDVQLSVKEFLDKEPRRNPFKNNFPQDGWYKAFLRRNPELTERTAEGVTSASAAVSENNIRHWFQQIESYLLEKNIFNVLSNPERLYNGDETNFQFCPKTKKVLALKGARNVYEVEQAPSKTNLTVLFTFSADGNTVPPMIVYPLKRISEEIGNSIPDGWSIGKSDNGWMTSQLFYEYIANVFHPFLIKKNISFPVILFLDGHSSHLTYNLSQLCTKLNIILIALYPNATRILQPADVAAFKPIKSEWKKVCLEWTRKNPKCSITKEKFAHLLKDVVDKIKSTTLQNGFKSCGLYPYDPNAIDFEKCLGKNFPKIQRSELQEPDEDTTINFQCFKKIVGANLINSFVNNADFIEKPEKNMLRNLYLEFVKVAEFNKNKAEVIANKTLNENVPTNVRLEDKNQFSVDTSVQLEFVGLNQSEFNIETMPVIFEKYSPTKTPVKIETINENNNTPKNESREKNSHNELEENLSPKSFTDIPTNEDRSTGSLRSYLYWPETPVRKGKRKLNAKDPFVITSSGWKKIKEEKLSAKKEVEKKKEERKKRLDEKLKLKIRPKQVSTSKKPFPLQSGRNYNSSDEYTKQIPKINILSNVLVSKSKESHVKYLFKDEIEKEKIILDQTEEPNNSNNFKHNTKMFAGLCFICCNNIHAKRPGIKCFYCLRTFHPECIRKHQNMPPIVTMFICKTCNDENKS